MKEEHVPMESFQGDLLILRVLLVGRHTISTHGFQETSDTITTTGHSETALKQINLVPLRGERLLQMATM